MGMLVWHKGKIGYSIPNEALGGVEYAVVNDTGERFFTPMGFIYPITLGEFDLMAVLEGNTPIHLEKPWANATGTFKYVRIDHDGRMWQYTLFNSDDRLQYEIYAIPYHKRSSGVVSDRPNEVNYIKGLMAGGATIEQINRAGPEAGIDFGIELTWTTMHQLQKKLQKQL